ncbi:VWA domain-containing protein [Jannaschia marina]|uniref:VWA domain-containing protein n=1 Tax=Jannaschia marina TaxID=2741674 RepID=UPI0015C82466|nr:VWA domain-containing protein [Jannaschia marina]
MTISNLVFSDGRSDSSTYNGANGIEILTIGDRTFVYTAAFNSSTISIDELSADGTLTPVDTIVRVSGDGLSGVSGFTSVEIDGRTFLYASAEFSDAVTAYEVAEDGTLTTIETVFDDATLELDSVFGELTVATVGSRSFLIAHGNRDDGLSVFRIGSDGTLTNTDNLDDTEQLGFGFDGIAATTFIEYEGRSLVFATGFNDDAVTVLELGSDGTLSLLSSIGDDATLEINGAEGVAAIEIDGTLYLYVGGGSDAGLSVFEVAANGTLTNAFNYTDTQDIALSGVNDLEIFSFGGTDYLAATGQSDSGFTIFEIVADGSLTENESVFDADDQSFQLSRTSYIEFVEIDGEGLVVVSSFNEDAISVFRIDPEASLIDGTDGRDVLVGTVGDDTIAAESGDDLVIGQDGDDRIDAGQGSDVVNGGDGDDLLQGDGDLSQTASDVVTVAETGQDLALTVTLPDSADGSTIEINGIINRTAQTSADFNIVYVIDTSGSMSGTFSGTEFVADQNGDGADNQLIDGTISAFQSLNESVVDAGFTSSDVAIITFDSSADTIFRGTALADVNGALSSLRAGGGTDFEDPLQLAIEELERMGDGQNVIYFISDGDASTFALSDEVATLTDPDGLDATINVFGLGQDANMNSLDLVDDFISNNSATRVLLPSEVTSGLTGSPVDTEEVDRLEVYVNGVLTQTIDGSEFALTPFGLQYNATIEGLSTSAGDVIEVVLVASDSDETQVMVSLTVPNDAIDEGDDVLIGGAGLDTINGDGGDDTLMGDSGSDAINGGTGDDLVDGGSGNDRLVGGSGDDTLIGGAGADVLQGGTGDDVYYVDLADTVNEATGAPGDFDVLASGLTLDLARLREGFTGTFEGIDLVGNIDATARGDGGDNLLDGNRGDNLLVGRDGDDTIAGRDGDDRISGGDGDDSIRGDAGDDTLFGNTGDDTLRGISGENEIRAGSGEDFVVGGSDNDTIDGGSNADRIVGADGDDRINGGSGGDLIFGNNGEDTIFGDSGHDEISGGNGDDVLLGRDNDDTIRGANDDDRIFGGADDDVLAGNNGDDEIQGGSGDDRIFGGAGNDTIEGGTGTDFMDGGSGADVFVFEQIGDSTHDGNRDTIRNFAAGTDRIDLTGLGDLTFVSSYTGTAGEVRYNDSIGRLYVDIDGDRASDFSVDLLGVPDLGEDDLIL